MTTLYADTQSKW